VNIYRVQGNNKDLKDSYRGSHEVIGEHKHSWGGYAALRSSCFAATGLNPGNQSRTESLKLSFRMAVRTARKGCTVQRFHLICWLLAIRLAMISLIADSTQPVEMGLPARRRSP